MPRRRGHNEGTYYQLKNGRWRAQVSLDGKRLSATRPTRQAAIAWINETLGQINQGLSIKGVRQTLAEFMDGWERSVTGSKRKTTMQRYTTVSRDYIIPYIGNIKIKDLRPDHVQALYNQLQAEGKSVWLVIKVHSVLHQVLRHAAKIGVIAYNPASKVIVPTVPDQEINILDDTQVSQLLLAARGTRYETFLYMAVTTGMRLGEILGLKWDDVDWVGRSIRVERQLGKDCKLYPPKTRYGRRSVALGERAVEVLRSHLSRQQIERKLAGDRWKEHGLVFPTTVGTPWSPRNALRGYKVILERAGLPDMRFHDLRHTAASLMLNHGVPVLVVSRRLGHARASITLDLYGHMIPSLQYEAAEKMDSLVSSVEVQV